VQIVAFVTDLLAKNIPHSQYTQRSPVFARNGRGVTKYGVAKLTKTGGCYGAQEDSMLKKEYVRDGQNRVIGSVTTGFEGAIDSIVRDEHEQIVGTTSERFHTTRDENGGLVSINSADAGLLINPQK
jgi:hypothetical protein